MRLRVESVSDPPSAEERAKYIDTFVRSGAGSVAGLIRCVEREIRAAEQAAADARGREVRAEYDDTSRPIKMIEELRTQLGLSVGARPESPKAVWQETLRAIDEVADQRERGVRAEYEPWEGEVEENQLRNSVIEAAEAETDAERDKIHGVRVQLIDACRYERRRVVDAHRAAKEKT